MEIRNRTICIILHYGSETDTWNCARSVLLHGGVDILVADNDPAQNAETPLDLVSRVAMCRTGGQAGFSAANNMSVRFGRRDHHEFVLILNNDTLVESNSIFELVAVLEDKGIGAAGPCIAFASDPSKVWSCGGAIKRIRVKIVGLVTPLRDTAYDVDYLPGAAILCRLDVWDRVGGLPEKYFLAYEEAEFALRIKACGYRIVVAPKARILHRVGMSSEVQPMYTYNSIRNRVRFGQFLHGKKLGYVLAAINTMGEITRSKHGYRLWVRGLLDELLNTPLDRAALQKMKSRFGSNSH